MADLWRHHLSAGTLIDLCGKGLRIPERWTATEFARQGGLLLAAMARLARLTQRKAQPVVVRIMQRYFRAQLEEIIDRATFGTVKAPGDIQFPIASHEHAWARAIEEVFGRENIEVIAEVSKPVQSVVDQAYSRVGKLLNVKNDPKKTTALRRITEDICAKVTRVDDTTRNRMARVIRQAIDEGADMVETARRLQDKIPAINEARARTIARTELNNAYTQSSIQSFRQCKEVTHVSVIGCEAREPNSPKYRGESTCNIEDVPIEDADKLIFHPNHTGCMVPSRFKEE